MLHEQSKVTSPTFYFILQDYDTRLEVYCIDGIMLPKLHFVTLTGLSYVNEITLCYIN